jgi:hypothetical protein
MKKFWLFLIKFVLFKITDKIMLIGFIRLYKKNLYIFHVNVELFFCILYLIIKLK